MLSGLILRIKVNYMNKLLPNQVYAGLFEILKDQTLYYHSKIGANYCHLTEEGEKEVLNWIKTMAPLMYEHEQNRIDKRAKEMVWSELKK
jgi:hypothetical protein